MSYRKAGSQLCLLADQDISETVDFATSEDDLGRVKFKVDESRGRVGYINSEVFYSKDPETAYQQWCRDIPRPPTDLQHFTQSFNRDTVER